MNLRLHTPIIACTASALVLSAGLLSAAPALSGGDIGPAPVTANAAVKAHVQGERAAAATRLAPEPPVPRTRRARNGFALPYFSFARAAAGGGG